MNKALSYFQENYKGKKIIFYITGGGITIADLMKYPGISSIIEAVYLPYGRNTNENFVLYNSGENRGTLERLGFCSFEANKLYLTSLKDFYNLTDEFVYVIVNCALTTTRYRKGENKAYITIEEGNQIINKELTLYKIDEEVYNVLPKEEIKNIRIQQDEKVALVVLSLLLKTQELFPYLHISEKLETINVE